MKMRPNATASAWPFRIAASAASPVNPPAVISTPFQIERNSTIADGTGGEVGCRLQELLDEIAVGAVHLDAVEAGCKRVLRRLSIGINKAGYLRCLERARRLVRHRLAVGRPGFQIGDRHRRWRDRQHAARLE